MQAQWLHSPPTSSRSTIAVFRPPAASLPAQCSPAGPAPSTIASKESAIRPQPIRPAQTSAVLDDDALEDVGGVLASVDAALEPFVDVLPADDRDRVDPTREQRRERLA